MSSSSNDQPGSYWAWKAPDHGIRGFFEDLWHYSVGAIIHGAESLFETHGGSAIIGPAAQNQLLPPKPPPIPQPNAPPHSAGMATLAPQQADIHNNFSTANQYQARFGVSQSHF